MFRQNLNWLGSGSRQKSSGSATLVLVLYDVCCLHYWRKERKYSVYKMYFFLVIKSKNQKDFIGMFQTIPELPGAWRSADYSIFEANRTLKSYYSILEANRTRIIFNTWGKPHTEILLFNTWGKPHTNNIQYLRPPHIKSYYSILEANRTRNLTIQYLRQTAHEILLFDTWGKQHTNNIQYLKLPHTQFFFSILEANHTPNLTIQYFRQIAHEILLFNTWGKPKTNNIQYLRQTAHENVKTHSFVKIVNIFPYRHFCKSKRKSAKVCF
jgi:hypothetical protein